MDQTVHPAFFLIERSMTKSASLLVRFARDESGATMVEYGLMVGLIAVVCIVVVTAFGSATSALFVKQNNAIGTALGS